MITQAVGCYCMRSALTVVHHSGLGLQAGFFLVFFGDMKDLHCARKRGKRGILFWRIEYCTSAHIPNSTHDFKTSISEI